MKKWTVFIGGNPYIVEADKCRECNWCLMFEIGTELVGRFMWEQIDGYVEVK